MTSPRTLASIATKALVLACFLAFSGLALVWVINVTAVSVISHVAGAK